MSHYLHNTSRFWPSTAVPLFSGGLPRLSSRSRYSYVDVICFESDVAAIHSGGTAYVQVICVESEVVAMSSGGTSYVEVICVESEVVVMNAGGTPTAGNSTAGNSEGTLSGGTAIGTWSAVWLRASVCVWWRGCMCEGTGNTIKMFQIRLQWHHKNMYATLVWMTLPLCTATHGNTRQHTAM